MNSSRKSGVKSSKETEDDRRGAVPQHGVKSNAVVKYSAAIVPAPFTILQSNTNLNSIPPNWLSNSVAMYGVPSTILSRSGFSSFAMANTFPDCIGGVDVVSDAENVKKLLKMAYSSSPVSLMVHRVENTLLIDDFDVKKALLASEGRWGFFRKFFEHAMQSMQVKPEIEIEYKDKSRTALQSKSLISKFFYHSLVPTPGVAAREEAPKADPNIAIPLPFVESDPQLPEPRVEEELPDAESKHKFSRNVVWTFEDIQMLLGTDIPIFGGGTHPLVSLKLRDMSKPINVLTGMDYWLDNLMCNVPEVVMCYHLNGIVQRYELIKTEDLPHLPNSKFSPKVIRDIAQNILSFLKSNATKAGHTYWLFKGRDDDVVKLYDLTCLCGDVLEEGQTPFTVPVAMLLYRVARNMKNQDGLRQAATVCTLLRNCVALLPESKYPEIATSAHYMLADVYLPFNVNPREPDLEDKGEPCGDEEEQQQQDEYLAMRSMSLAAIREPQDEPQPPEVTPPAPPPLSSDVTSRCADGLKHVLNGLRLLSEMNATEPDMVNPSEAIPMPCTTPQKSDNPDKKKGTLVESPIAVLPKSPAEPQERSWANHLKILLLEKAVLIYLTLLENAYSRDAYGVSLRYAGMAMRVSKALDRLRGQPSRWEGALCGRAGDALMMVVHAASDMGQHDACYRRSCEMDETLQTLLRRDGDAADLTGLLPPTLDGLEPVLLGCAACYSRATVIEPQKEQQLGYYRCLGNVENELGVFYMNKALKLLPSPSERSQAFNFLAVSLTHLDAGVATFTRIGDRANLALLYSNTGRLMRLRAHFYASAETDRSEMANQERMHYNKAISNYQKAIEVLGERAANPNVWDSVYWELSSTYYTLATLLQDYPAGNKSHEQAERELTDTLHKALKYCDLETTSAKLPIYQFRAAKVHHRLASLHHCQFRNSSDEGKRKHTLQLSKLHYEKAARLFQLVEYPKDALMVQMERIGMTELLAERCFGVGMKVKHLTHAMELMVDMLPTLQALHGEGEKTEADQDKTEADEDVKELTKVLALMLHRLQQILLTLVKLTAKKRSEDKKNATSEAYKELYGLALRCSRDGNGNDVAGIARALCSVLSQLAINVKSHPTSGR